MVLFLEKRMELKASNFGMQTQLNSANNIGWVPSVPYLYGHNGTFARNNNGATGLKLCHADITQLANNMAWVPSSHTSSFLCVRLKMSNWYTKNTLT